LKTFGSLALAVFFLAGCGGSGGGSTVIPLAATQPSPLMLTSSDPHFSSTSRAEYRIAGTQSTVVNVTVDDAAGQPIAGQVTKLQSADSALSITPVSGKPNTFTLKVNAFRSAPIAVTATTAGTVTLNAQLSVTTTQELWVASGLGMLTGYAIVPGTAPLPIDGITIPQTLTNGLGLGANALTTDANGDLWAVLANNNTVVEYAPPFTSNAPSLVLTNVLLGPTGLTFDAKGNLWVTSFQNPSDPRNVSQIHATEVSEYTPPFTSASAPVASVSQGLFVAEGVAFDASGNMWVANFGTGNVALEYTTPFTTASMPSATLAANCTFVSGIAIDAGGDLAISCLNGLGSILQFPGPLTPASVSNLTITSGINQPSDLAFDGSGNLWVTSEFGNDVTAYNATTHALIPGDTISNVGNPTALVFVP
jgi:sugar lactone lactonase YvrE